MRVRWVRTAEMELPLVKLTVEPLRIQRVIADVARNLAFLRGRDVLVCLPTGSGKSLCFALLPKVVDGLKAAGGVKFQRSSILYVLSSSYQSNGRPSSPFFSAIGIPSIVTKGRDNLEIVSLGGCVPKEQRDSSAWAPIARYGSMCPSCDIAQSPPSIMHMSPDPTFRDVSHFSGSWG